MLPALPQWLVSGLLLGVAASVVVAAVFALGERYIPDPEPSGRRVGGARRQRAAIRAFFEEIGEPFYEDYEVGYTQVAFYLPERDVAITFDPRAFLRLDDTDTFVILCEHELRIATLARRLPFDVGRPSGSRTSGRRTGGRRRSRERRGTEARAPRGKAVDDAFDTLGLARDADEDAVKTAYREQVKEVHPDQGGSQEEFQQLQDAYATAKEYAD
ncbi:J domain-containing protein [Halolamina salifodinae]|uniref:J domain-containing protein n=1 Tax=Halolamina salifodinae TaxID=1202767 RepID=A0A8T4H0T9_9EURY|nr:J domain-containing protein [Halolamina salifodinae]MBP1986948.1 hypothetical protein [Halolamina salifodinae]